MQREAAEAGFYTSADGSKYPRVQLLTIKGLLEGTQRLERPLHVRDVTFRELRAPAPTPPPISLNLTDDEPFWEQLWMKKFQMISCSHRRNATSSQKSASLYCCS